MCATVGSIESFTLDYSNHPTAPRRAAGQSSSFLMILTERLTPNFRLGEFLPLDVQRHYAQYKTFPAWSYYNTHEILRNIKCGANRLQVLSDYYQCPILINMFDLGLELRGFRLPEQNLAAGGAEDSQHLLGKAYDVTIVGVSPQTVQQDFCNWSGGLGCYDTFTHLDIRLEHARW